MVGIQKSIILIGMISFLLILITHD